MRFLLFVLSFLLYLFGTVVASPVLSERQTDANVENARQAIIRNNGQSFCIGFLPPVTTTRVIISTRNVARATVARSTRTVRVVRTSTTTTTSSTTFTRTITTTTTTTAPAIQPRQVRRPAYLSMFSDATVTAACRLVVSPRTVTSSLRTTTTIAARTTTSGTTTTSTTTTSPTTLVLVRTSTTTSSPPEPGVAGSTVTTGSPLCRDFTGNGAIAQRVQTHRFSRTLGQNAYVNDWEVPDAVACCNSCANARMGCTFWRWTDGCMIIVNPTTQDTCPAPATVMVTTSGRTDRESMAGPGPCQWDIRVQNT
ncbi:hypothetical protein BDD12DRAFT_865742 [Trichophaea hybrida]|nr:hypothetical protein BDD12DRAFT_865742 [Trichophaea hybrida]